LADKALAKSAPDARHYVLTGRGWRAALELRGDIETQAFKERLGKLCAWLKGRVKGRRDDAFVAPQEIEEKIGISRHWVSNTVDAMLIERCFRQRGVQWFKRASLIRVPIAFGLDLL
jgi:hypothetical protein